MRDPLGLDYVAQQVGLLLLPTPTTRSTRAQAYAMVLYGLALADRAVDLHGYANTQDTKRELHALANRLGGRRPVVGNLEDERHRPGARVRPGVGRTTRGMLYYYAACAAAVAAATAAARPRAPT